MRGKGGGWEPLPCFPLPFSAPCEGLEAELVPFAADAPERVAGRASLVDAPLLRLPPAFAIGAGTPGAGGLADEERVVDPEGSLDGA